MIKNVSCFLGFLSFLVSCGSYQGSACLNGSSLQLIAPQQKQVQKAGKPDQGKIIFERFCMSCHQKDGSGVPGMYPPLQESDWVNGDKNKIIKVVINGLQGDIEVNGEYYSQVMPTQAYLTNKQIAQVLSYIRTNLDNHADSVELKDVEAIRKESK